MVHVHLIAIVASGLPAYLFYNTFLSLSTIIFPAGDGFIALAVFIVLLAIAVLHKAS